MLSEIKMPHLGLTMIEGTINKWFFQEGDEVKAGDELLELTTDKLTNTMEAPCDGILLRIYVSAGNEALVGAVLAVLGEAGEEVPKTLTEAGPQELKDSNGSGLMIKEEEPNPDTKNKTPELVQKDGTQAEMSVGRRVKASPLAKKLAQQKNYAIEQISGSGPGGRVIKKDVDNFVPPTSEKSTAGYPSISPLVGIRKVIAERMSQSWHMSPHVTLNREINMCELVRIKEKLTAAGEKSSYTEFIVKACAIVLMEMPELNRSLIDGMIHTYNSANIGVAVGLPDGLIVPVVKDAQIKSVQEIRNAIKDLSHRARNGKSDAEELTGGTFTVSNLGMYGIDTFTPVINPPESAILGVNRVIKKTVVVEIDGIDTIEILPMMNLSLSIDHRLVDGATGAVFMQKLVSILENPYLLF